MNVLAFLTWRNEQASTFKSQLPNFNPQTKISPTKQPTRTAVKNTQLPYLDDTGIDGKKLYTPKEWTERMRHYIKRIHNVIIKQILSGEAMPTGDRQNEKEPEIRQDIIRGAGPSATEIITKGEFSKDPDNIKTDKRLQLFREDYIPTRNTNHSQGDFVLGKTRKRKTRKTLEEVSNTAE